MINVHQLHNSTHTHTHTHSTHTHTHTHTHTGQISEEESLFTYPPGMTTDDYSYPDHSPVFLDELLPNADPEIVEFCDGDPQCVYDYTETNDSSIANSTKMTNMENVNNSVQASMFLFKKNFFLQLYVCPTVL